MHAGLFFVAPFLLMGVWQAVVFVLITQTAFGFYLGASFLTNHVGMPVPSTTDDLDYLRRQVLTSRNLRHRLVTGFMVGGLDAQIEHHLFPTMPRANLAAGPGPGPVVLRRRVDQLHRGQCLAGLPRRLRPPVDHRRPAAHPDHGLSLPAPPTPAGVGPATAPGLRPPGRSSASTAAAR